MQSSTAYPSPPRNRPGKPSSPSSSTSSPQMFPLSIKTIPQTLTTTAPVSIERGRTTYNHQDGSFSSSNSRRDSLVDSSGVSLGSGDDLSAKCRALARSYGEVAVQEQLTLGATSGTVAPGGGTAPSSQYPSRSHSRHSSTGSSGVGGLGGAGVGGGMGSGVGIGLVMGGAGGSPMSQGTSHSHGSSSPIHGRPLSWTSFQDRSILQDQRDWNGVPSSNPRSSGLVGVRDASMVSHQLPWEQQLQKDLGGSNSLHHAYNAKNTSQPQLQQAYHPPSNPSPSYYYSPLPSPGGASNSNMGMSNLGTPGGSGFFLDEILEEEDTKPEGPVLLHENQAKPTQYGPSSSPVKGLGMVLGLASDHVADSQPDIAQDIQQASIADTNQTLQPIPTPLLHLKPGRWSHLLDTDRTSDSPVEESQSSTLPSAGLESSDQIEKEVARFRKKLRRGEIDCAVVDVWLVDGDLLVGQNSGGEKEAAELSAERTLDRLYIQPLSRHFKQRQRRPSTSSSLSSRRSSSVRLSYPSSPLQNRHHRAFSNSSMVGIVGDPSTLISPSPSRSPSTRFRSSRYPLSPTPLTPYAKLSSTSSGGGGGGSGIDSVRGSSGTRTVEKDVLVAGRVGGGGDVVVPSSPSPSPARSLPHSLTPLHGGKGGGGRRRRRGKSVSSQPGGMDRDRKPFLLSVRLHSTPIQHSLQYLLHSLLPMWEGHDNDNGLFEYGHVNDESEIDEELDEEDDDHNDNDANDCDSDVQGDGENEEAELNRPNTSRCDMLTSYDSASGLMTAGLITVVCSPGEDPSQSRASTTAAMTIRGHISQDAPQRIDKNSDVPEYSLSRTEILRVEVERMRPRICFSQIPAEEVLMSLSETSRDGKLKSKEICPVAITTLGSTAFELDDGDEVVDDKIWLSADDMHQDVEHVEEFQKEKDWTRRIAEIKSQLESEEIKLLVELKARITKPSSSNSSSHLERSVAIKSKEEQFRSRLYEKGVDYVFFSSSL